MTTHDEVRVLALRLMRYFTETYGEQVWVLDPDYPRRAKLAHQLDFWTTKQNPWYAEDIPEHERPWFRSAAAHEPEAYRIASGGGIYVTYDYDGWLLVTDEFTRILL